MFKKCSKWHLLTFLFFLRFIYLFESQSYTEREGEAEREVFHLLVHSPIGHNGQSCADPKPGARSFFWVSHMGTGAQGLGPSSTAFPGHSRELNWKWSNGDLNQRPYGMPTLQVATFPAMPQRWPSIRFLLVVLSL